MDDNDQTNQPTLTDIVPEEVRDRLAVVAAALAITPRQPARRGGFLDAIAGEQAPAAPSVTDALRIARFACDDHRDIAGVDQPDPLGVTAEDLLTHLTRKES